MENNRFKTLGAYLKSRRERLQPAQAGLGGSYGQRRTPGLRREEVAILAGVSATYYTWLEQGREVNASREVMENIAIALQLTPDEKTHLMQLWNPHEPVSVPFQDRRLKPHWQPIINQLTAPSFITNERSEVLAWNPAAAAILADFAVWPADERIMIRILFTSPELRGRIRNWEEFARHSVAVFRTYYDKHPEDPWFSELVQQLCAESGEFAAIWKLHQIQIKKVTRLMVQAPGTDDILSFDIRSLMSLDDQPDLHICVYTPVL
ncbi:helix-turn-helix domain-containing protein [Paenibacillus albidus]|uniref:helix-turn-helix transcriptional regulator n=1 Tax=Paenibacillus albidus TaxID=2041023 RepID=UPI001BE563D7|nr:helix-turn-helix transcriptional regulator [Paenibacillus albidus]MBT2292731.1 helix-turn-helix domain-containing protein [Paenibacillus albidus]